MFETTSLRFISFVHERNKYFRKQTGTGVTDEFSQILSAEPIPGGPEEITQTQPCAGDDFIMTQTAECSQVEEPVRFIFYD